MGSVVPLGLAGGRRVVIGGECVVWMALCRWNLWGGRRVRNAVPLEFVGRASCRSRCAVVIGMEGVVWLALCHLGVRGVAELAYIAWRCVTERGGT